MHQHKIIALILLFFCLSACDTQSDLWNDPYPESQEKTNTLYLAFSEPPKRLDPATAYLVNENQIIYQIYQPPLQYHYLLRPYTLIPQTLTDLPQVQYFDQNDQVLPDHAAAENIAYTRYELHVKPGIFYQPHPAFAQDAQGNYLYHQLTPEEISEMSSIKDFPELGTRELIAADYVYQIKRLASPNTFSPILALMRERIVGMDEYAMQLSEKFQQSETSYVDLRLYPLAGVEAVDRYTYQIKVHGKYPQFLNWLAMTFFSPVPWEADAFYQQAGLDAHNISLNWYPIGTGPYYLAENNPNQHMVLKRNPNFYGEQYPTIGTPEDEAQGLLKLAGQALPFIDEIIFTLEKESIPQWNKFLQGYYDYMRLDTETFEQAIQINTQGLALAENLQNKNLKLESRSSGSVFYWGFNMKDPIVGGYSEKACKLRQAISLVVDIQEFINIFLNGLAEVGIGPIPPEIFGYEMEQNLSHKQKMNSIERLNYAKQLLVEAGYPNGLDANGKPLVLAFDSVTKGGPDAKARLGWMRKQLNKLGIELEIRATQLSRFQQKMRTGDIQLYYWTWIGDYPDPENFLFLFYGPSSVAISGGNNRSNYQNPRYDELFDQMKNLENSAQRAEIIQSMIAILNHDIPWYSEIYPNAFTIEHEWVYPMKPSDMIRNTFKYQKIDPDLRAIKRSEWNQAHIWPLWLLLGLMILVALPVVLAYYHKQYSKKNRKT